MIGSRRVLLGMCLASVLGVCVGTGTGASASPVPEVACPNSVGEPGCTPQGGVAEFALFGTPEQAGLNVGDSVSAAQLQTFGAPLSTIDAYANGAQPVYDQGLLSSAADPVSEEAATQATAGADFSGINDDKTADTSAPADPAAVTQSASNPAYTRLYIWRDNRGRLVDYRRGYLSNGNGFGDTKIRLKHNMNYRTAFKTSRYPAPGYPVFKGGYKWEYRTVVNHYKCSGWFISRRCTIDKKVTSLVSIDFKGLRDGHKMGVITNYVIGYVRAPDWVKGALNA